MAKSIWVMIAFCALSYSPAQAQEATAPHLDLANYSTANPYFHSGAVSGLSEAIVLDKKKIGLSSTMSVATADEFEYVLKHVIERRGLKYYREEDFLVTDMFPEERTKGKVLLVIYKNDKDLEDYFAVKKYKQEIIDGERYDLAARREIATRFGKLLSYSDEQIEFFLKRSGLH